MWQDRIVGTGTEDPNQLLANPRNWRVHPKQQQDALAGVLDRVGWVQQVIVNRTTGHLVDGHLRVSLAMSRDETEVPVVYVELSPEEEALILATLDPLSAMAGEDRAILESLLDGLNDADRALVSLAHDGEVGAIDPDQLGEDDVPPLPGDPRSRPGDLWLLGEHRLLVGDATNPDDVARLMNGNLAECIFTDPPYNVAYVGGTEDELTIANDNMSPEAFATFLRESFDQMAGALEDGGAIYVCHSDTGGGVFRTAFVEAGFLLKQCLVWVKSSFVLGRRDYHWAHEPILYGWKPGAGHRWYGQRIRSTVLDDAADPTKLSKAELVALVQEAFEDSTVIREDKPKRNGDHPTMKPVRLVARLIANSTAPGDIVLDPFGGSGSTLVAAEHLGRTCYLLEIDPRYADVVVARWEQLTGQEARLA